MGFVKSRFLKVELFLFLIYIIILFHPYLDESHCIIA